MSKQNTIKTRTDETKQSNQNNQNKTITTKTKQSKQHNQIKSNQHQHQIKSNQIKSAKSQHKEIFYRHGGAKSDDVEHVEQRDDGAQTISRNLLKIQRKIKQIVLNFLKAQKEQRSKQKQMQKHHKRTKTCH